MSTYTRDELEAVAGTLAARLEAVSRDNEGLARENAALAADVAELARSLRASSDALASAVAERDAAFAERDEALAERDAALAERDEALAEAAGLRVRIDILGEQIDEHNRLLFGTRSETLRSTLARKKVAEGQLSLFNDVEAGAAEAEGDEGECDGHAADGDGDGDGDGDAAAGPKGKGKGKGKGKRGPKSTIDWSKWEDLTEVVEHELPEGERVCPQCGAGLVGMGYDVVREFRLVPAHVEVIEHRVHKYVCPECSEANREDGGETRAQIVRAEPPARALPGTLAHESLLAHIIRQKYEFAMPVYRIWTDLSQEGMPCRRQSMCRWVIEAWQRCLAPLEAESWRQLRGRRVLHMDETTVQVLKEPGREASRPSYMWGVASAEGCGPPAVHFEYHPGRQHHIAADMVGDLECVLVTDGYGAYDDPGPGVVNSRCMYHIRKPFALGVLQLGGLDKAVEAGAASADAVLMIGELFDLEAEFRGMAPDERARARCERSWPVVARLCEWAAATRPHAVEGTRLAKGIDYMVENLNRMSPWLCDGQVPMDNIRAERCIRPFTVGRKNWLFCDTVAGAEASAGLYSIVQTAVMNGMHTGRYLEWALTEIARSRPSTPEGWARLLPWSDAVPERCRVRDGEAVGDPTMPCTDDEAEGGADQPDDPLAL